VASARAPERPGRRIRQLRLFTSRHRRLITVRKWPSHFRSSSRRLPP